MNIAGEVPAMRLVKFSVGDRSAAGILLGDVVHVVGDWWPGPASGAPFGLASLDATGLERALARATERLNLDQVRLAVPIGPGNRIIAVGFNYLDHAAEAGATPAGPPAIFLRDQASLVPHLAPLVRPAVSTCFDYEGELAVIVGRPVRHVPREEAAQAIAGYTCFMDGSLRDFQKQSVTAGKNFHASGAMGPWILPAHLAAGIGRARIETRLNGATVQSSRIECMVHDCAALIAYCSAIMCLEPGDVIATGTPAGVGFRRTPPLWLAPGDRVEVFVEGIGTLANPVIDEPDR